MAQGEIEYVCYNIPEFYRLRLGGPNVGDTNDTTLLVDTSNNSIGSNVANGVAITSGGNFTLRAGPISTTMTPSYRENIAGRVLREIKNGYTYKNEQNTDSTTSTQSFHVNAQSDDNSNGNLKIQASNQVNFRVTRNTGNKYSTNLRFQTDSGNAFVYCLVRERIREEQDAETNASRAKFTGALALKFVLGIPIKTGNGFNFSYKTTSFNLYAATATAAGVKFGIKPLLHSKLIILGAWGFSFVAFKMVFSDYELQVLKNEHNVLKSRKVHWCNVETDAVTPKSRLQDLANKVAEIRLRSVEVNA